MLAATTSSRAKMQGKKHMSHMHFSQQEEKRESMNPSLSESYKKSLMRGIRLNVEDTISTHLYSNGLSPM